MATTSAVLHLTPIVEPVEGECPACGFGALVYVRVYHLTVHGPSMLAERIMCARCAAEGS